MILLRSGKNMRPASGFVKKSARPGGAGTSWVVGELVTEHPIRL